MLCIRGTSHGPVSVCPSVSVTSQSSTKMAKRRMTQTTSLVAPSTLGTLVFWCQRSPRNSTGVTPYEGAECRWGGQNRRLSTNNLGSVAVFYIIKMQIHFKCLQKGKNKTKKLKLTSVTSSKTISHHQSCFTWWQKNYHSYYIITLSQQALSVWTKLHNLWTFTVDVRTGYSWNKITQAICIKQLLKGKSAHIQP